MCKQFQVTPAVTMMETLLTTVKISQAEEYHLQFAIYSTRIIIQF